MYISSRQTGPVVLILITVILFLSVPAQSETMTLVGDSIKNTITLTDHIIIEQTDSLFLNGEILLRDSTYHIDYKSGILLLNNEQINYPFSNEDTLTIYFEILPEWIGKRFGIMPEITDPIVVTKNQINIPDTATKFDPSGSHLDIRGSKRFGVNSQSDGTSRFDQSLDLSISGELTPGLTITGSLSDKGYDPEYGAINSRISELDRLFIRINSKTFSGEIGNLELKRKGIFGNNAVKQVSGISGVYTGDNIGFSALLARPRGIFQTAEISGANQVQGPYRIISGSSVKAIVPGSETVWLDGAQLERGVEKDYIIDYPLATITFTPKNIIDSRSRIEIDFEQLSTEYRKEIYELTGSVMTDDDRYKFDIGFSREGDNKSASESIDLSDDDIDILSAIGDSITQGYRESVVVDSFGAYIELIDGAGQAYYEYVGDSLGDYSISFSSVSSGEGSYIYEGVDRYRYVGDGNGDYVPLIRLPVPEREDYYRVELSAQPVDRLTLNLQVKQSDYDRNLFSSADDNDNLGGLYQFSITGNNQPMIGSQTNSGYFSFRKTDKSFRSKFRTVEPDLKREYLLPRSFAGVADEYKFTASGTADIPGPINIFAAANRIEYNDLFSAIRGTVALYPHASGTLLPTVSYTQLQSEYNKPDSTSDGRGYIFTASSQSSITKNLKYDGRFRFDRRRNDYFGQWQGTSEERYRLSLNYKAITLSGERYLEDTLEIDWRDYLTRDQLSLTISKTSGKLRTNLFLTAQRLDTEGNVENRFMAKTGYNYNNPDYHLSIDGSYLLSDENRFERGIRYLEVEPGQGRYIYDNGQYIPDEEGNYIEVEEIYSSQSSVSRAEKSINLLYSPDDFYIRLGSNISEELYDSGDRNGLWVLPFYYDGSKDAFSRKVYYSGEMKFINLSKYYLINLSSSYNYDARQIEGAKYKRYEFVNRIKLNNSYQKWRFIEQAEYFRYFRDAFYFTPDDIEGYKIAGGLIRTIAVGQLTGQLSYRYAETASGADVRQYSVTLGSTLRLIQGGETIFKIELYAQDLQSDGAVSYRLTDNLYGKRGAVWTIRSNNKIGKDLRLSISFTGRHSDDRSARIYGKGELVASF